MACSFVDAEDPSKIVLSLVDWRWAAKKGFWDPSLRKWDESKGGFGAYITQRNREREGLMDDDVSNSAAPADAPTALPPSATSSDALEPLAPSSQHIPMDVVVTKEEPDVADVELRKCTPSSAPVFKRMDHCMRSLVERARPPPLSPPRASKQYVRSFH
jgi:hypothetical protein